MPRYLINNQKGQSLLELMVAIAVITSALFSVWNLFLINFSGEQEAKERIVAVNLAREGLEAVKNIRDTNWLKIEAGFDCNSVAPGQQDCHWDDGFIINTNNNGYAVPLGSMTAGLSLDSDVNSGFSNIKTKIYVSSANNLYVQATDANQGNDNLSPFNRLITLQNLCCDDNNTDDKCDNANIEKKGVGLSCESLQIKIGLNVLSEVRWVHGGRTVSVKAEEQLFNWK